MVQVMNFKRQEVTGATKKEALAKAPFTIIGDATQKFRLWKKSQVNGVTDADIKQFMLDYLMAKSKNAPGVGFSITIESAVANTREHPYTIIDKKNESGSRKYKQTYQLIDKSTCAILAETNGTKAKAKKIAKDLIVNKGFKGKLKCTHTKQVVGGEAIAFEAEYTPSKSSRIGTYLVFGFERN